MKDLDFGGINGDGVGGHDSGVIIVDGAEPENNFGCRLEASEKRRNEDPMDRKIKVSPVGPELPATSKSPVLSVLG